MQVPPPPGLPPSRGAQAPARFGQDLPATLPGGVPPMLPQLAGAAGVRPVVGTPAGVTGNQMEPANPEEAAKAFASILFGYMFAEMRPKEEDSLLGGGDTEMFMDFFDQAMARNFVDQGNPLVDLIVDRLSPKDTGKGEAGPS